MDPARLLEIAQEYYSRLLSAPKPKAQSLRAVLKAAAGETKVWEHDGMKLETRATQLPRRPWLHAAMADEKEFYACMRTLACGKATGMDGIPTELLRMMPDSLKRAAHHVFLLMWLTGVVPDSWKASETCLLYKGKGSELSLKFYRPITLEKALYKAFTALATRVVSDYAEEHGIMCEGQAGGRRFRSTTQVVDVLTMACEDARAFKRDLYILMIDFTAAFNTIDQDDMLAIMHSLGFPCDALAVVHAMYTGATTIVALPAGKTAPIPVQRGTLQGNIMSPLLFNLYMNPLMRWLEFGALGYKFGCLGGDQPALAARAFLDDVTACTGSISALHAQAAKVTVYGNRYHIESNADKSVVTAALHAKAAGKKALCTTARNMLVHAHNAAQQEAANQAAGDPSAPLKSVVELQGRKVTYVPPSSPFKLLGVHMTALLDWSHARTVMTGLLVEKLKCLNASFLTPTQKLRVLETNVRPALAFHMSITPCTPQFLDKLDRILGRFVKRTLGLVQCVPTAMLREELGRFGIGCASLTAEYASACAKGLVDALQDPALRGVATKALLSMQLTGLTGLDPHACGSELNYCLRARQLAVLHKSDMALLLCGTEQFPLAVSGLWTKVDALEAQLRAIPSLCRLLRLPGLTDMRQLVNARGTHVLSAKELAQVTGRTLPRAARVALLQLTAAVCGATPTAGRELADLPASSRRLLPAWRISSSPPPYPAKPQQGSRQRMLEECFALLTTMVGEARTAPQADPPQETEGGEAGQRPGTPPAEGATAMETDVAPEEEAPPPAQHEGNKRRRMEWHKAPCGHRCTAKRDETLHRIELYSLHTPPCAPLTSEEMRVAVSRQALAARLEAELLQSLGKKRKHKPSERQAVAGQVASAMYDSNFVVAAVHASRMVKPPRKHKRDVAPRPSQMQMLVEWRPALIDAWARPLVERAGYVINAATPVSRAELHADPSHTLRPLVNCELCCGSHGGTQDLWWCNGCHKTFHTHCLGMQEPGPQPPVGWACPTCAGPARHQPQSGDEGLVLVEWGREWHPLGDCMQRPAACFATPEGREALKAWAEARDAPAAVPQVAADAGMPNMARQQPEDKPGTWKTTRGNALRAKVKLHVTPVNPQADIIPPGTHTIVIRDTDTWQGDGEPHGCHTLACVYGPDGRLVGTLGVDALATLKGRYDEAAEQGQHKTLDPPVGPFEREVADLICRYRDGHKFRSGPSHKPCTVSWATSPSAPRHMLEGLVQTLGITKERFASPLDVHHSVAHYNSAHPRDAVFGADPDAYASAWTGWSWCHPPHSPADLDKAVAWAAASARAAQDRGAPSATLMLLPRLGTTPPHLQRLGLNADVATHLGTIRGGRGNRTTWPSMHHLPAGWWAGGPANRLQKTKQDVDLVLVWNEAARADTGRHATAVAAGVRRHGPDRLQAHTPGPMDGPTPTDADVYERWLGRLLMDTVRATVGLMNGLRMEYDRQGGPSQGVAVPLQLPTHLQGDDEQQLGSRAVQSWLGQLATEGPSEPPMSCVYGGESWGLKDWSPHWRPRSTGAGAPLFPKGFGKARECPEGQHWNPGAQPRVHATGWVQARDTLRPQVACAMQTWGTPEHAARHPLAWDWREMAYTDGSLSKPAGREAGPAGPMGAAVYVPAKSARAATTCLVAPGGEGPSWTITRAELAAIWVALSMDYTTICTDSLASIWLIQAAVCDPMRLRRHKHRPLLEAIVALIDSAPCQVTIVKVAAHQGPGAMGAVGNNEADNAAKLAAQKAPEACDWQCTVAPHGFYDQLWIGARTKQPDGTLKPEYVGDLRADLTRRTREVHRLGTADPDKSVYASLWRTTAQAALPAASNAFASDPQVSHAQRRTVWAYRTGTLFNKKLEKRWFKTGDGLCPLCKQPDGGGHIAGGCLDPRMRGMYTARHDAVARVLLKAIARGNRGGELCGADVGSAEHLQAAGLGHLSEHRRVAPSLLPPRCTSVPSRPDAWLVTRGDDAGRGWMNKYGSLTNALPPGAQTWVTLVEFKCCPDTDPTKQRDRANEQHEQLEALLKERIGGQGHVTRKTILVGHSGTLYSEDSLKVLEGLGVERTPALKALGKAHRVACQHLHSIVGVRRHLAPPFRGQGRGTRRPP